MSEILQKIQCKIRHTNRLEGIGEGEKQDKGRDCEQINMTWKKAKETS
jgi:hypothetical protein